MKVEETCRVIQDVGRVGRFDLNESVKLNLVKKNEVEGSMQSCTKYTEVYSCHS